jgi:hypothetical protein
MTESNSKKSLKDQNRWQLWLTIAMNAVLFFVVARADVIVSADWRGLFAVAADLLPIGFAMIVTSVANGLLSANMKARLVFLRWKYALPGHRAFSQHALADPRIDTARLKKSLGSNIPEDPGAENRVWYRIFKEHLKYNKLTAIIFLCGTTQDFRLFFSWDSESLLLQSQNS